MDGSLDDIRRLALARYDDAVDNDRDNRDEALDDLSFAVGEQWPEDVKRTRESEGRPVLTINRMPQFIRQVTGDIRATNPAVAVTAGDSEASEEMAEVFNGMVRQVEYRSDASSVYERAAESAATCGMGNFRVVYEPNEAGENEIKIEAVPNPFAVYYDPLAKDPTRKDARFVFITERLDLEDFKRFYPDARPIDFETDQIAENLRTWYAGETIQVAEYFWRENGQIMWAKMTGEEILAGPQVFPGDILPVFFVPGEEIHIGDRTIRTSVIRYAKDAQRLYNFWRSAQAELIALQPKAPYKVTPKQIQGYEAFWQNANTANYPYLPYNPDERAPGAPQREVPPAASSGMMQEIALAADDLQATTGIYDSALGARSNETSGVAIRQRQLESDISTSIYVDNLSKAIAQCGRCIVGLIPFVYDTTRIVRTLGEDGSQSLVELNVPMQTPFGPVYMNDPSIGVYDVRVRTGPSYSTQRQEAAENMIEFVRAFPDAAQVAGDLIAKNMDWPGAEELAKRLAAMLPPGMRPQEDLSPEEQQQMAMAMQDQQVQQQAMQAAQQIEMRRSEAEVVEAEADARKAQAEAVQTQIELAIQSGQMNAAIQAAVDATVARMLGATPIQ